jgi:hypothetical protein
MLQASIPLRSRVRVRDSIIQHILSALRDQAPEADRGGGAGGGSGGGGSGEAAGNPGNLRSKRAMLQVEYANGC